MEQLNYMPGTWEVDIKELPDGDTYLCVCTRDNIIYEQTLEKDSDWYDEAISNAKLIAKAPAMYELLQNILKAMNMLPNKTISNKEVTGFGNTYEIASAIDKLLS